MLGLYDNGGGYDDGDVSDGYSNGHFDASGIIISFY